MRQGEGEREIEREREKKTEREKKKKKGGNSGAIKLNEMMLTRLKRFA